MVRKRSEDAAEVSERLDKAAREFQAGKFKNINQAAKAHKVYPASLTKRLKNGTTRQDGREGMQLLSKAEEKATLVYSSGVRHKNTEHLRSIYVSTFGLIFLGTPHNGADQDKWRHMLRGMAGAAYHHEQPGDAESQLIDSLNTQSETLQNINIAFANIMNRFRVFFFYEALKTQVDEFLDFIVDQMSAAPILGGTERAYIEATHLEMCRFASSRSRGYELVVEAIKRYAHDAPTTVQKRWQEEQSLRQSRRWQEATELMDGMQRSIDSTTALGRSTGSEGGKLFKKLPFERNGSFVGREGIINIIESRLAGGPHENGKPSARENLAIIAPTPAPPMEKSSYSKTYRVQGIPATYDRGSTKTLLQSTLDLPEGSRLEVQSLAPSPYEPKCVASKVVTFTFDGISPNLTGSKRQWTFSIPPEDDGEDDYGRRKSQITIDSHFEGFTSLNGFKSDEEHKIDCIAIPGLGGHPFGSFKERGGSHMWLRDSLPYDLPGVYVMTYGYDSHLASSDSFQDLEAIASSFRAALRSIRSHSSPKHAPRPLIFIVHSLGGLVLKEALIQMKTGSAIDKDNFKSAYGALFFGVPNQGMDISSLIPMAESQDNLPFLLTLGRESAMLRNLHRKFCETFDFKDFVILSYYETEKSPSAKKEADGRWAMSGEPVILPISRNHSDLVKYSMHDAVYYPVRDALKEFCRVAVDRIRSRFSGEPDVYSLQRRPTNESYRSRKPSVTYSDRSRESRMGAFDGGLNLDDEVARLLDPAEVQEELKQMEYAFCPGTGQWVFESSAFINWSKSDRSNTLYISRSPGSGKTFLVYRIASHLRETYLTSNRVSLSAFFCDSKIEGSSERSALAVLKTFTAQLLDRLGEVGKNSEKKALENLVKSRRKTEDIPLIQFHTVLSRALLQFDVNYIAIDALDECDDWKELLNFHGHLLRDHKIKIKFVLSSRVSGGIPYAVSRVPCPNVCELDTGPKTMQQDIEQFVHWRIQTSDVRDIGTNDVARDMLVKGSQGLFLLASLRCSKLEAQVLLKHDDVKRAVEDLPDEIHTYYKQALDRLHGEERKLAKHIFMLIVFAQRALTVSELIEATAVKRGDTAFRREEGVTLRGVEHLGGGLTVVVGNKVQLAHSTVKEFAASYLWDENSDSNFSSQTSLAHNEITGICITYMSLPPPLILDSLPDSHQLLVENWPLYRYVSRYWMNHLESSTPASPNIISEAYKFLKSNVGLGWWRFYANDIEYYDWWSIPQLSSQFTAWIHKNDVSETTQDYDFVADLSERHVNALKVAGVEEDMPVYVAALTRLANHKISLGKLREGEMLLTSITERVTELQNHDILIAMLDFCELQRHQGLFADAEVGIRKVLEACQLSKGKTHRDTLNAWQCLGDLKRDERLLEESVNILKEALNLAREHLGEEDPNTLAMKASLANTYIDQENFDDAEELMGLQFFIDILGEEHPGTLTGMDNLAELWLRRGHVDRGVDLMERVNSIRKVTQGVRAYSTLTSTAQLACAYRKQGKLEKTKVLQAELTEIVLDALGPDHPLAMRIRVDISVTKMIEGDYEQAAALQQAVLDDYMRQLGANHIWTQWALAKLALTKQAHGKLGEAERMLVQVLEGLQYLGDDHIDALRIMEKLAHTRLEAGKTQESILMQEEVLRILKKIVKEGSPTLLVAMENLASMKGQQGQLKEAEELRRAVLAIQRKILGPNAPATMKALANLALTYADQGLLQKAGELQQQFLAFMQRELDADHPAVLVAISNLASTYRGLGKLSAAEEMQKEVFEARRQLLGETNLSTVDAMENLALILVERSRLQEAEKLQRQVLEERKKQLDADHASTSIAHLNLASTFYSQGRLKEAEKGEREVFETRQRLLGPEHLNTVAAMAHLALTYAAQGRYAEAEELEVRILDQRSKQLYPDHPDVISAMANLASTFRLRGNLARAEEMQLQVLSKRVHLLGPNHLKTLNAKAQLACTLGEQCRYADAGEYEIEVLTQCEGLLGLDHPRVISAMISLAATHRHRGDLAEAEGMNLQILSNCERIFGADHLATLDAKARLAIALGARGRRAEEEELERQVLGQYEKLFEPDNPKVLLAMSTLAATCTKLGKFNEAEEMYRTILDRRRAAMGPTHPLTLEAMHSLAFTYDHQGRGVEAKAMLKQVLEICERAFGSDHSSVLSAMAALADFHNGNEREHENAARLSHQVFDAQMRIHGPEH